MTSVVSRGSRRSRAIATFGVVVSATLALDWSNVVAQSTYSRGQSVSPAYEGWEIDPDGSKHFVFGYMNRNWEETLNVPVGEQNKFEPGPPDRGQPTRFQPRRNAFVFRIPVPANFGEKDELVWTLTTHGRTEKAYGTLHSDYIIDNLLRALEMGAVTGGGALDPAMYKNKGPTIELEGATTRMVKVGEAVDLAAVANDDGIPKRRNPRPLPWEASKDPRRQGRTSTYGWPEQGILTNAPGLRLSFFVYRGEGRVTFDPEQTKTWQDTRPDGNSPWSSFWTPPPVPTGNRWTAKAVFQEPGRNGRSDPLARGA
jgi:hypothetical protein